MQYVYIFAEHAFLFFFFKKKNLTYMFEVHVERVVFEDSVIVSIA